VWEANHVWLIFVLTVTWTAYPTAFGAIATTLSVPLFIAGIGIVLRGAAYALRPGARVGRESKALEMVFSLSSILTPFALGTMIGGIAARRVRVGGAAGHLFSSWLNPTSLMVGVLAVAFSAYLAAVYLAADAGRGHDLELQGAFRLRALLAGMVAGVAAIVGLVVVHADVHVLYHELLTGAGLPALIISVVAGVATMGLVLFGRFAPARYTAAVAVAAIVAGWAAAQQPLFLSGLTIRAAAAPHDTLVAVIVVVLGGAAILFPSLALLFRLTLGGQLREHGNGVAEPDASGVAAEAPNQPVVSVVAAEAPNQPVASLRSLRVPTRLAIVALLAGVALLVFTNAAWTHAVGVVSLLVFILSGFAALGPDRLAAEAPGADAGH
jgi:cytochrome bd ubiquinol oxidase subunit II